MDSNICVYAFDKSDPKKQETAFVLFSQTPIISSQVLIETYNACFRKLKLPPAVCKENILILTDICPLFKIDIDTIRMAFDLKDKHQFSFLDSMITASALLAGCSTLYSEDMQHGLLINEVLTIINPFV